jgi:hypothetical protein
MYHDVNSANDIFALSFFLYKKDFKNIQFGDDIITLDDEKPYYKEKVEGESMNYFFLTKYNTVEENVLYSSKVLYELLIQEKHIDQLFIDFAENQNLKINLNVERILFLSLTFLFSLGKVSFNKNMIRRIEGKG